MKTPLASYVLGLVVILAIASIVYAQYAELLISFVAQAFEPLHNINR